MHVTILNHICTSAAKLQRTKITIKLGVSIQFLPCDAVATCLSVLNTVMMLCCRTYHLMLVTEFPHSTCIGSYILPVFPQHIPAFSLPHFICIQPRILAFLHSRILPTPAACSYLTDYDPTINTLRFGQLVWYKIVAGKFP